MNEKLQDIKRRNDVDCLFYEDIKWLIQQTEEAINHQTEIENIKKNILSLSWSMDDAPYFEFNKENIKGVNFAIDKILKDTGITIESLLEERKGKKWFEFAKERDL